MTGAFVSRRRAEEFDAMVSAPAPERDTASQEADLLDLVGSLRSMPEVSARPDFVTDLRSQLIVEAARQARPVVDADLRLRLTPRRRSGTRERRAATISATVRSRTRRCSTAGSTVYQARPPGQRAIS